MNTLLIIVFILIIWYALQAWILPRLGIST